MVEEEPAGQAPGDEVVVFRATGEQGRGTFRCSGCGYGVSVEGALPACPMCGGIVWEEAPAGPFARPRAPL